jgi:hypothetical protein
MVDAKKSKDSDTYYLVIFFFPLSIPLNPCEPSVVDQVIIQQISLPSPSIPKGGKYSQPSIFSSSASLASPTADRNYLGGGRAE